MFVTRSRSWGYVGRALVASHVSLLGGFHLMVLLRSLLHALFIARRCPLYDPLVYFRSPAFALPIIITRMHARVH